MINVIGLTFTGAMVIGSQHVVLAIYERHQLPISALTRMFFSVPNGAIVMTMIVLTGLMIRK